MHRNRARMTLGGVDEVLSEEGDGELTYEFSATTESHLFEQPAIRKSAYPLVRDLVHGPAKCTS